MAKPRREKVGIPDIVMNMSEGNQGAINCIMKLINDAPIGGIMDISLLNSMGIRGVKICKLWNLCHRDVGKLKDTIQAFRDGKFSEAEIQENLSSKNPQPFITE